jgi:hypothetical protein
MSTLIAIIAIALGLLALYKLAKYAQADDDHTYGDW